MNAIWLSVNFDFFMENPSARPGIVNWNLPAQNGPVSGEQVTFEPCWLGDATGRGAEPRSSSSDIQSVDRRSLGPQPERRPVLRDREHGDHSRSDAHKPEILR